MPHVLSLMRKVLCVDWDRRALRLVVARVGQGVVSLEDAHSHPVPDDVDVDDPVAMGGLLARMLRWHGWRYRRVIVDVARDKAVINRLTLPPTPLDELAAAVQFQAMRELPFPLEQAAIDYVVTARNSDGLATEVMLAAMRREALTRLRETCRVAGLTPTRIGLRPYANLVSVRRLPGLAEQRVLFVDVGPAMTEIDVICGGVLTFSRAANVTVPPHAAVDGALADGAAAEAAHAARETAVRDLEVEITRTLQAYRATEPNALIDRIVIAGGVGIEHELLEAVDRRFGLPCELFDPSRPLGLEPADGVKLRAFSAALGLAWGLSREGLLELDFLNPKRPVSRAVTLRKRARLIGVGIATLAVAGAAAAGVDRWQKSHELQRLEDEVADLRRQDQEFELVRTQVERVREMPEPVWLDDVLNITEALRAAGPEGRPAQVGERIVAQRLAFDRRSGLIRLRVVARDYDDLARLEAALNGVEADGQPLYRVRPLDWAAQAAKDGFGVTSELEIDVLRVQDAHQRIDKLERERRTLLREIMRR
jgi:type IV pilus assembly protein PilM